MRVLEPGDAGGWGRGGGTFCLHVWESVVSAGWGVEEVLLLFPSAGKQCPRRVFYGSCWTLISFVTHLSPAAAALSPQSVRPPKPRTTRAGLTGVNHRIPKIPHGHSCNKSIKDRDLQGRVCIKKNHVYKDELEISLMNNFPLIIPTLSNPA